MRRRDFITLFSGTVATWPVTVRAQQRGKRPVIAFVGVNTASSQAQWTEAFVQRLRELGWSEPNNISIEYRWRDIRRASILVLRDGG